MMIPFPKFCRQIFLQKAVKQVFLRDFQVYMFFLPTFVETARYGLVAEGLFQVRYLDSAPQDDFQSSPYSARFWSSDWK